MKQINTIIPSFKEKNLTAFAGLNPIFQYLVYSLNIFELLDRQVTFKKKKKNFTKQDYFKILFVFFLIGYERLKHILLLAQDQFVLKLLNLTRIVMPENIVRCFLVKFNFKHTHEIGQVNAGLLKKKHKKLFSRITNGYCIVDCDSTPRDTHGHQEATGKHYKNHNGYHPIMAFIYQTKEFLHGYLRPGATYTGNGIVEFLKESLMRLPYCIKSILFRADSGFFNQYAMQLLEKLGHYYLVAAKLHKPLMQRILQIPNKAYRLFKDEDGKSKEIVIIHYQLPSWDKARKFVVVRTVKKISDQLTFLPEQTGNGLNIEYSYQVYCTNLLLSAEEIVKCYQERGNSENYIKEIKQDLNLEKTTFDKFWHNEAFFQIMMLVYNCIIWFKAEFISVKEAIHERIYTFRFKYLFIPAKLKTKARQFYLDMPGNFQCMHIIENVFLQTVRLRI
jgi:hypothetical protein